MPTRLRVGLVGAGPVVQSIHLPTLLRLRDRFEICAVTDISPDAASLVAARTGARVVDSIEAMVTDAGADVVAICTPAGLHAVQVVQALRAGARGVFCEKPFAVTREDVALLVAETATSDVPVHVGTMHSYDPAWLAAARAWSERGEPAHTVTSRIVIPRNDRYEDWATEFPPRGGWNPELTDDRTEQSHTVRDGLLGLGIHSLQLVRALLPDDAAITVEHAEALDPWGYLVIARAGGRIVQLTAQVQERWNLDWTLEAFGATGSLHLSFPPSFVHAGSAVATLRSADATTVFGPYPDDGYEGEWRQLGDAVSGDGSARVPVRTFIDDLSFAVELVNQAMALVLSGEDAA